MGEVFFDYPLSMWLLRMEQDLPCDLLPNAVLFVVQLLRHRRGEERKAVRKSVPREGPVGRLRHLYFVHCIKGESTISQVPENEAGSTPGEKKRRGGRREV